MAARKRILGLSSLVLGALLGCGMGPGVNRYQLTVRCQTGDGRPVPLVMLSSDQVASSEVTDPRGVATLLIDGREGEEVALHIDKLPPDHTELQPGVEHKVVLKNVGKVGAGGIEVGYDLKFRRTKESYSVLVAAEKVADLAVAANGVELARLNSHGAAAFRVVGRPGEELKVAILTADNPRASEPDPTKVFVLPENGGVLSFRSNLTVAAVPAVVEVAAPVVKRKHHKAAPLAEPKQIPFGSTLSAEKQKKKNKKK